MDMMALDRDGFAMVARDGPEPAPGEIVVAPTAVGICEGDGQVFRTRHDLPAGGVVLGHEATGIVTTVGVGVADVAVGDRVATLATRALATRVVVDADLVVPIRSTVGSEAALGEPVACCVHAMGRVRLVADTQVAVVGAGFMGLVCVALARSVGADVTVVEPVPTRRHAARGLGVDQAVDPTGLSSDQLRDRLGPHDVVVEAVGTQAGLDTATALTTAHGALVVLAYHQSGGGRRTVPMQVWNYRALDVVNGHVRRVDEKVAALRTAVDLIDDGTLDLAPLVRTWPLAAIDEAMDTMLHHPDQVIKAVLTLQPPELDHE